MDAKLKHLEFILGVVNRLAMDSFRLKGWTVTLVVGVLVLLARGGDVGFAYIALVPVLAFWGLDGYFLWQERLYRLLYDRVRRLEESEIDFSMSIDMQAVESKETWLGAALSRTVAVFYGALAGIVCVVTAVVG